MSPKAKTVTVTVAPRSLPEPKVTASTLAGAVVSLVVWVLHSHYHVDIPPAEAVAAGTVLSAVIGYVAPHLPRVTEDDLNN